MPLPVMVRIDDEYAEKLRELAQVERRSMNRVINEAIRLYLEACGVMLTAQATPRVSTRLEFRRHLDVVRAALKPLAHQETQADYNDKLRRALEALTDCVEWISMANEPDTIPFVSGTPREKPTKVKVPSGA